MIPIMNSTRYNTNDLEAILKFVLDYMGPRAWIPMLALQVVYFETASAPHAQGRSGPFVRFTRNEDENTTTKQVALVRPNRIKGISPAEKIVVATTCMAPMAMVEEVAVRMRAMIDHHKATYACSNESARNCFDRKPEFVNAVSNSELVLRFSEQEVTQEVLNTRSMLYDFNTKVHTELSRSMGAEEEVKHLEENILRTEKTLANLREALVRGRENLLQTSARLEAARAVARELTARHGSVL